MTAQVFEWTEVHEDSYQADAWFRLPPDSSGFRRGALLWAERKHLRAPWCLVLRDANDRTVLHADGLFDSLAEAISVSVQFAAKHGAEAEPFSPLAGERVK